MSDQEKTKYIVIKRGSSTVLDAEGNELDGKTMSHLADDISDLIAKGVKVVLITSGARELGREHGGDYDDVRTDAMVGQPELMGQYVLFFKAHGIRVGQLLVPSRYFDVEHDDPETGVIHSIVQAGRRGILVIANENDPMAPEETTRGDNDSLAEKIALGLHERSDIDVDSVVLMSVNNGTEKQAAMGKGGAEEKAKAIRNINDAGIDVLLINGKEPHAIAKLYEDKDIYHAADRKARSLAAKVSLRNPGLFRVETEKEAPKRKLRTYPI